MIPSGWIVFPSLWFFSIIFTISLHMIFSSLIGHINSKFITSHIVTNHYNLIHTTRVSITRISYGPTKFTLFFGVPISCITKGGSTPTCHYHSNYYE
uniref:Uncharacterized protein n=1 Tax=uncultured marine group II/III euryarchaeote AD1000_87_A06 TaxID=1457817 RepID=A0A075G4J0_9EURY|nr:hypothetical protein [uncultured marine group II/III euryarchaeote AD1000_87_A06]